MHSSLKIIVERIKTFTLDSLVEQAIFRISKKTPVEQPWVLLSFLEIAYRECDNSPLKFKASYQDFKDICQQIFELINSHPLSDFTNTVPKKIFYVMAYQQFPYQAVFDIKDIQRQCFIFNAETPNSKFNIKLKDEYGFSVSEFLKLWEDLMNKAEATSSPSTAEKLLNKLTIKHQEISNKIQTYQNGIRDDFYKTFVADFFTKYPFIEYNKQRYCIGLPLFKRTLNEFLFERVIEWQDTKGNFDERFQQYIDSTLQKSRINYKNDQELKSERHKECDFLIQDFLFAECKAIKINTLAQANPSDQILENNLSHILKAYKQILSTANRYKCTEYFGAIITFLPFYFSDCTDIWNLIEKDIMKYLEGNNFDLVVKPDHLFFIDIKSWDKLIDQLSSYSGNTLKEIFQDAYETNKKYPKFEFAMHLKK